MKSISKFFTLFWIIYFPVCIAFAFVVDFDLSDEILTMLLLLYAIIKHRYLVHDKKRATEIKTYIVIMVFYLLYSLVIQVTTMRGGILDFMQQLRPYAVFYLTWMLAPEFTRKQKKWIKLVVLASFFGYLLAFMFKPGLVTPYGGGESSALGQIALCSAMVYYLFSRQTKQNRNIAIFIMLLGLFSGKSKYFGECLLHWWCL